mgnify:FL=1
MRYERVEEAQWRDYRRLLLYGSVTAAAVALPLPLLHAAAPLAAPVLVLVHLVLVRAVLVRDAMTLLSRTRRGFVRWVTRLSFLWLALPGYTLAAAPLVGAVVSAATFAGLTTLAHHYVLYGLCRERDRMPLAAWEKLVLLVLAALTGAVLIVLLLLLAVAGFTVHQIADWLRS